MGETKTAPSRLRESLDALVAAGPMQLDLELSNLQRDGTRRSVELLALAIQRLQER